MAKDNSEDDYTEYSPSRYLGMIGLSRDNLVIGSDGIYYRIIPLKHGCINFEPQTEIVDSNADASKGKREDDI